MKQRITFIAKGILILLAGTLAGILLLAAAFLWPVNLEHQQNAYEIMEKEGWYPSALVHSLAREEYFFSYEPGILDNGTDRIMLYTAMDTSAEGSVLTRAMNMYCTYLEENYSYYWHGYVSILRPLLYFWEYGQLRFLNWAGQFLLMFLLGMAVHKKTGRNMCYVLLLMTSYLLLMPQALAMSLQFTWVFYIGAGGCLLLIKKDWWFGQNARYIYFFLITGMLTSYFDLLTYPLFTWGFPLLWWLVTGCRDMTGWKRVNRVAASGAAWIAGYGFMWVMKWAAGSVILQRDLFGEAFGEVFLRSGIGEDAAMGLSDRLDVIYQNWLHYQYPVYFTVLLLWLLWAGFRALRYGWHSSRDSYAYLLTGCSSFVWYLVLADHTRIHHFFTYRIFNVSVTAFLLLLAGSVLPGRDSGERQIRGRKGILATLLAGAMICGLAGSCAFLAREEIQSTNAQYPVEWRELEPGGALEYEFVPAYSEITHICVCLEADQPGGTLEITVSGEGEVLCRERVELSEFVGNSFRSLPVEWKLQAGKEYVVQYKVTGNEAGVRAAVTEPGNEPLGEIGQVVLNGEQAAGQPAVILSYWAVPASRERLFFLACSWLGVLTGAAVAGYTAVEEWKRRKMKL